MENITDLHIDSLVKLLCTAHVSLNGGAWYTAPYIYRENPTLGFDARLTGASDGNQKELLQIYKKGTSLDTISVILEYTKTTD